jgi:soluble lytic murein transglycosylase-like protein
LRAIAHAESYYAADAVSDKGAIGVMQLMPDVIADYAVDDPISAAQSIEAGARLLKALETRYGGDRVLAAAAYNAGIGAVTQYSGVPPFAETREYVAKVSALYARYRKAMGQKPRTLELAPAR